MTVSVGTKLGPYEIQAPLGAGGMGEVYRAKDAKLGREIAVKVLPAAVAADGDRRAALRAGGPGGLRAEPPQHPHRLRHRRGRRRALHRHGARRGQDPARARRLRRAAADQAPSRARRPDRRGTGQGPRRRHRPPGPEARERHGLEGRLRQDPRLRPGQADRDAGAGRIGPPTAIAAPTQPGTVMGTAGYMSPEQAQRPAGGLPLGPVLLGAILYEMATGKRAFQRKTGAETLVAIIREEPEPLDPGRAEGSRPRALDRRATASPRTPRSATPRPRTSPATSRASATT